MPTSGGSVRPTLGGVSPPSIPVRSSHSNGLVLVALVLGLVLGATAVGMVWFVAGRTAYATELPDTTAGTDAAAACATLARVPPLSSSAFADRSPLGVPAGVYRLAGAASLAQAAKAEDSHYSPLSEALSRANLVIGQQSRTGRQAKDSLDSARAACADL
jgi:hypothetical protein